MKNVKRILALMVVVAMMLSIISVSAFAGDRYDASLKFTFKNADENVVTEAKSGDIVDLYVSIKTFGYANMFEFVTCYDTTVLTQISAAGTTKDDKATNKNCSEILDRFASSDSVDDKDLLAHEAEMAELAGVDPNEEVIDWGSSAVTVATHKASFYPSDWDDTQKGQYKCIKFSYMADSGYSNLTINTNGEFVEMARIRFYCVEDTVLNNTTLFLSPEETASYIGIDPDDEPLANYQKNTAVDANLTVEYEGAGGSTPAPQMTIVNASTQVQWQDKATGKLRLGFRGNVQNLVPDFVEGSTKDITNIKCMGIVYSTTVKNPTVKNEVKSSTVNGETVYYCEASDNCTNVPTRTLYDFTSGGYFFRSVVGGVGKDDATVFYANAYIVLPDDTIVYATNGATETSGKAQYERAQANLEK